MKLVISAKCSDLFWAGVKKDGEYIEEYGPDYVPDWMPGQHFGDYVELEIDPLTGQILDWQPNKVKRAFRSMG